MTTSRPFADLDHISVFGISARGFHGVLEQERLEGQTFLVDVELGTDIRQAAAADDLAATIDYSAVAASVISHIVGQPHDLIETLAERIAATVLTYGGVEAVRITVHKPEAPVGVPFRDVTITIVRPA
jgi:dihydroneopterin aldolase